MRNYIFEFEQQVLIDSKITLQEALLLDYLSKFSGNSSKKYWENNKYFFWITYSKIQKDLPILGIKRKQIYNIISSLINKNILETKILGNTYLYIHIDYDNLYFKKTDQNIITFDNKTKTNHLQNNDVITKFYNKKVKILFNSNNKLSEKSFLSQLKTILCKKSEEFIYRMNYLNMNIETLDNNAFVLNINNLPNFPKEEKEKLVLAIKQVFSS